MKRIFLPIAAVLTAVVGSIALSTGIASAWHPLVSGQATCISDGTWTVDWTVANSESGEGSVMSFDSAVNGERISLSPSSVAPSGSATGTSTHTADTDTATLVVNASWANSDETASRSASVDRPADCVPPTTTPTTEAPATTTTTEAPTTTTTEAPTTTTEPVVVVTTTVPQVDDTTVASVPVLVTAPAPPRVEAVAITAAVKAAAVNTDELPATGTASMPLIVGGVCTLLVGIGLVVAARRRGAAI